jgi:hypothetical protein
MSVLSASVSLFDMFGLILLKHVPVCSLLTPIRKLFCGVPPFGGSFDFSFRKIGGI